MVLVDHQTATAAEDLARRLQRAAGVVVVGTPTAGAEAATIAVEGRDGLVVTFGAVTDIESSGRGLRSVGVIPNVSVNTPLSVLRSGTSLTRRDSDGAR